ncbi:MAG: glycosyltransferase family 4 protein [Thermoproteota archaeon]
MKILMLVWEYPPRKVGGLATHAYNLSFQLSQIGAEVDVITTSFPGEPTVEKKNDKLIIHRVETYNYPAYDFINWVMGMNNSILEYTTDLVQKRNFDIIHAHDWMVIPSAVGLKYMIGRPIVYSVHSTEYGRRNGIHGTMQRLIHETEGWGTYESEKIVVCSKYMKEHVVWLFNVPEDKLHIIPNGITEPPSVEVDTNFRRKYAQDSEKIILFVGRIVDEKGLNVLIGALPYVHKSGINAKLVVVGDGYAINRMKEIAWELGIYDKVYFTGYLSDDELNKVFKISDALAVPSLYEPFGIVALEGMINRLPVVVSDTGGLSEIIEDGTNGLKVPPNNSEELARRLIALLSDESLRKRISELGYKTAKERYNWGEIAYKTLEVYKKATS